MWITAERAKEFGIAEQRTDESDLAFRTRVSEAIRSQGHILEAHEAYYGLFYDEIPPENFLGAVAREAQNAQYGGSQIAADIAAGAIVNAPPKPDAEMLLLAILLGGR